MATLVDWQIEELATNLRMIQPFNPDQLNPASYDVKIGPIGKLHKNGSTSRFQLPVHVKKGDLWLFSTKEKIKLPPNIEATFQLKSSRAREGWNHLLAGYIDPGYEGYPTLEVLWQGNEDFNVMNEDFLFGQIRFNICSDTSRKPYNQTGHYMYDLSLIHI